MAEIIVVICPTWQGRMPVADWHDGQFAHDGAARNARRTSDEHVIPWRSEGDQILEAAGSGRANAS
ncbi:hypothetical protein [Bradyrhizobium sp. SZCCHNR1075]|uniref:hypothetical protein n=1 Tax=Bradyrhizobium sp. SZCCHNR1075 TaxID=3057362 RepID=UPI0028EC7298|nr:hypothetical protein [Bradyrhizobium sp. SZCCHNR1075]